MLMRIPKLLLVLAVAFIGEAVSLQAQRADTDLQAKAREQLRQKMADMGAQPAAAAPTNAAPAAPVKAKPPPAAPMVVTPPPAAAPVYAVPAVNSDAQAKAEAAMRQRMAELDSQKPATATAAPVVPVTPPAAVTPPPVRTAPPVVMTPPPVAPPMQPSATAAPVVAMPAENPEAQAKAQAALRQKMVELDAQRPAVPATPAPPVIPAAP